MASGVVQLWAWILHSGDQGWQQRRVLGRLQPPGATPVNDFLVVCATPDADVYFELLDGTSSDYQAVRFAPDRRTIPPGIDRGRTYRFRREPTAAELGGFMGQARQAADDLYVQLAAAAGLPALAPPAGALIPFAPPAAAAAAGAPPGALAAAPGAAPLAGGAGPAAAGANWVTVESTTFAIRGTSVILGAPDVVRGEVGIFTTPAGVAVLVRDLQAHPADEYVVMESFHDLRLHKATVLANKDRARGRFASSTVELRQSPFPDWPVPGPRTVKWCCEWLFRRQGGPLEHHRSLIMTFGLRADDWGVDVHHATMRCLDEGFCYDMVDVSNSAFFELILRKAQLVEYVYHMDFLSNRGPGAKGKGKGGGSASLQHAVFDESAIFSGMTKDSGMAMVSPELIAHVASEVERDAAILKQVRKAREERAELAKPGKRGKEDQG